MAEDGREVVRLSVKVEDGFRREVKSRAARQGLSIQEYVRDALAAKMAAEDGDGTGDGGKGGA